MGSFFAISVFHVMPDTFMSCDTLCLNPVVLA